MYKTIRNGIIGLVTAYTLLCTPNYAQNQNAQPKLSKNTAAVADLQFADFRIGKIIEWYTYLIKRTDDSTKVDSLVQVAREDMQKVMHSIDHLLTNNK